MNNHRNTLNYKKLIGGGNFGGIILTLTFLLFTLGTILPALADGTQPHNPNIKSEHPSGDVLTDTVRTDSVPSPDSLKIHDEVGKGPQL